MRTFFLSAGGGGGGSSGAVNMGSPVRGGGHQTPEVEASSLKLIKRPELIGKKGSGKTHRIKWYLEWFFGSFQVRTEKELASPLSSSTIGLLLLIVQTIHHKQWPIINNR